MGSVGVAWRGQLKSHGAQVELCEYIYQLALASERFWDGPSTIIDYDYEIRGKILVDLPLLTETSLIECIDGFKIVEGEYDDQLRLRRISEPDAKPGKFLLCDKLNLYGMQFQIFNPVYSGGTVSFVFIRHYLNDLDGSLVLAENRNECQSYYSKKIKDADWFVTTNDLHLRYFLERWFDRFLGWVKYFFIPDLYFWRYRDLANYDRFLEYADSQVKTLGSMYAAKVKIFEVLLDEFKDQSESLIKDKKDNAEFEAEMERAHNADINNLC